jgi:hypothetical protein
MTVVIGMMTRDGIVLGADTEETSSVKRDIGKLPSHCAYGHWLIIGGAGPASNIDTMTQQLRTAFGSACYPAGATEVFGESRIEESFRPAIFDFYQKHVLTWPSEAERADYDFSLIMGSSLRFRNSDMQNLWFAEKGTLRQIDSYSAIGRGGDYANILLDQYWHGRQSTVMSSLLMVYVLQKVKQHVPYCGKNSQVWCLQGSGEAQLYEDLIREGEELFNSLESISTLQFKLTLLAACDSSFQIRNADFGKKFKKLCGRFQSIAAKIEERLSASARSLSALRQSAPETSEDQQ